MFSSNSGLFEKNQSGKTIFKRNQYANKAVLANFFNISHEFFWWFCLSVGQSVFSIECVYKICVVKIEHFSFWFWISGIDWSKSSVFVFGIVCFWFTLNLFILWPVMVMFSLSFRFAKNCLTPSLSFTTLYTEYPVPF